MYLNAFTFWRYFNLDTVYLYKLFNQCAVAGHHWRLWN